MILRSALLNLRSGTCRKAAEKYWTTVGDPRCVEKEKFGGTFSGGSPRTRISSLDWEHSETGTLRCGGGTRK